MPTFAAAAGMPDAVERLKAGTKLHGKDFKVRPDGYNFLPFVQGQVPKGPREAYYYFSPNGELNAVRWSDWKINFAEIEGDIATGTRKMTGWPTIVHLRADPYEKMPREGKVGYLRWYADLLWLFVPVQGKIKEFLGTIPDYPFQSGASLNAAGIDYTSLRAQEVLRRLQQIENISPPRN
jgi:arylsulfatase